MEKVEPNYVGIDVSSERLDAATYPTGAIATFSNDDEGVAKLVEWVRSLECALVVMEATGGYEYTAASAIAAAGVNLAVVNPRQVRDFAKALGKLAKTDAVDAAVLAEFAAKVKPEPRPLPDEQRRELISLLSRRRQLIEMLTAERNRMTLAVPAVRHGIAKHIAWLKQELGDTDKTIRTAIRKSPAWREKEKLLSSYTGVGPVNIAMMTARLPELGKLNRKKIASLVGIAPHARDSGKFRGQRTCWGGRADVRAALYMAAVAGLRHNPTLRAYYDRLIKAGKPSKVALTACMRKILVTLNAMVRTNTPWQPERALAPVSA